LAVSFSILALGTHPSFAQDPLSYIADTSTGVILTVAGVLLWSRRPGRRSGPLLVLAGYLWYVGSLYVISPDATFIPYLGFVFRGYYDPIIAFVVLAFPADRLSRRSERIAVGSLVATMLITSAWRLIATPPGFGNGYAPSDPASPLQLVSDIDLTLAVNVWLGLIVAGTMIAVAVLALRRLVGSPPASRYVIRPALVAGAAWAAVAAYSNLASFLDVTYGLEIVPEQSVWNVIQYGVRILGPLGILLSVSRLRSRSTSVIEIVGGPGGAPHGMDLQLALRRAFDDPSLVIAYPIEGGWRESDGTAIDLDELPSSRVASIVASPNSSGVAIVHDELLLDEPAVVRTLQGVVGLAVDNDRLQADLLTQLEEVRASRARIAEAADAERRRVERDLHDGAQQRLVALLVSLRTIRSGLGSSIDPHVASELDAATAEVLAAIAEVRELAQGLDPAILREAGLAQALKSLADKSPVPVKLEIEIRGRLPARVETTAYFVVSEALANVAKHANATRVEVSVIEGEEALSLTIGDDGVGGADSGGHGLRGMADRIAAVDGQMTITSEQGSGTAIHATIPCES
jgi:signal transduction histidine kinase